MSIFEPINHPYVGTWRVFIPQGFSPVDTKSPFWWEKAQEPAGAIILEPGQLVRVESAWTRPYLPGGGADLLYVYSPKSGESTHVVAADLIRDPSRVKSGNLGFWE